MNKKEIRMFNVSADETEDMTIEGYAATFENPATHDWTEVIDKRAFDKTIMQDVCMKYNHSDEHPILARTRNGSLKLNVDDHGLKIRANLIDTNSNRDIYKMIKSGLLDKMSFAFTVNEEEWDYETDSRRILSIDKLFDVSVVDVPFYDSTEVFARSLEEFEEEKKNYMANKLDLAKRKLKMKLSLK